MFSSTSSRLVHGLVESGLWSAERGTERDASETLYLSPRRKRSNLICLIRAVNERILSNALSIFRGSRKLRDAAGSPTAKPKAAVHRTAGAAGGNANGRENQREQ